MNRKQLIISPTPELLDDALLAIIETNNEHLTVQSEYHRFEQRLTEQVDKELKEEGVRYRTEAEARVRELQVTAYEKGMDWYRKKKRLEGELAQMKMNYYHARDKIQEHRQEDINASKHGEQF